jgi:hypothetical protein
MAQWHLMRQRSAARDLVVESVIRTLGVPSPGGMDPCGRGPVVSGAGTGDDLRLQLMEATQALYRAASGETECLRGTEEP